MFLGVVSNPARGKKGRSERFEWQKVRQLAKDALNDIQGGSNIEFVLDAVQRIANIAERMEVQVASGVHVNGRGIKTSDHVQAIVYRHVDDNELYVHGFGDADLKLTTRGDKLIIDGLKDETHVQMFAQKDGSVRVASRDGSPVWEEFD